MPTPQITEDLSNPLEFRVKYETEPYRLLTARDGTVGVVGGMAGILGGMSLNAYLYSRTDEAIAPVNPIGEAVRQPVVISESFFGNMPAVASIGRLSASSGNPQPEAGRQVMTASSGETPPDAPAAEYQAAGVVGLVLLVAFTAVAASSALRYRLTQRRVNFTSDVDEAHLRQHYDGPVFRGPNN